MNKPYSTSGTIVFNGYSYGVIDNNVFQDCLDEILSFGGDGDASYGRTPSVGGYENGTIFVEDNNFRCLPAVDTKYGDQYYAAENIFDGNSGPRIVFRYNTVADHQYCRWITAMEAHGFESEFSTVGDARGVNTVEIYENSFTSNYSGSGGFLKLRGLGGGGVIFNNTRTGTGNTFKGITLKNLRSHDSDDTGSLSVGEHSCSRIFKLCS